jgi:hypothetical protein
MAPACRRPGGIPSLKNAQPLPVYAHFLLEWKSQQQRNPRRVGHEEAQKATKRSGDGRNEDVAHFLSYLAPAASKSDF